MVWLWTCGMSVNPSAESCKFLCLTLKKVLHICQLHQLPLCIVCRLYDVMCMLPYEAQCNAYWDEDVV